MIWHRHRWSEVGRAFTRTISEGHGFERISQEGLERLLFGLTIIELRCDGCGDVMSRELKGQHVKASDS